MTKAIKQGNGWYTDDAEYVVTTFNGSHAVRRGDGCYVDFGDDQESAESAAEMLAKGQANDSDFAWYD